MGIVVVISRRSSTNDELVSIASHLAASRCNDLLLLGVADVAPWIKSLAPFCGAFCFETALAETQSEIESELRRCIALVPVGVAARYACCGGWNDSALAALLKLEERPTVVAALPSRLSRDRRKLQAIVRRTDGLVMMAGSEPKQVLIDSSDLLPVRLGS